MKVCPKCGATTSDDTQSFCLMDGIQLVGGESQPTVVMPGTVVTQPSLPSPAPHRRTGLWIAVGVVILLLGGFALAGLLFYAYQLGNETGRNTRRGNGNAPQNAPGNTTARSTAPSSSPSNSPSLPRSPKSSPGASPTDGDEEFTPITWTTTPGMFNPEVGKTYNFTCPPNGTAAIVWGSDVYTTDSSICTAAVHWGEFSLKEGGDVTIEIKPGRETYGATTQNGVTTHNYGKFPTSFVFRDD